MTHSCVHLRSVRSMRVQIAADAVQGARIIVTLACALQTLEHRIATELSEQCACTTLNLFEQAITAGACSVTHPKPATITWTCAMLSAVKTRLRGLVLNMYI